MIMTSGAQKLDRVEQIRLADAIRSGDAGKRAKAHVHIDEVLESCDF